MARRARCMATAHGDGGHGHTHGVMDPGIASTERGIWAIKWSFIGLAITAVLQMAVVWLSGSVALLADTIHNVGDASTAIPLYVAFWFARRKPTAKFTYGYGRVEDLAGVVVVALILFSAVVAGYQAVDRLINPQDIAFLGVVAVAGLAGFVGNEIVAVFRIRVGREIQSAALIADGYHARVDGLTSLAVVLGAIGVWLGFPLADPIVGLVITVMIFGIVWQSAKAVFSRMLDGVEPEVLGGAAARCRARARRARPGQRARTLGRPSPARRGGSAGRSRPARAGRCGDRRARARDRHESPAGTGRAQPRAGRCRRVIGRPA